MIAAMKRALIILLSAALCLSLGACGKAEETTQEDTVLTIVVTVFPAYDWAGVIGGERCSVVMLVPPGSDIHSYEPTPRDIITIENCDLLIRNGGESEEWLDTVLEGTQRRCETIVMLECVEALEEEHKEGMQDLHEEDEPDGIEYDEHVWTSPRNAAVICGTICESLCALDSQGSETYRRNCEAYLAELDRLDAAFREIVAGGRLDCVVFADRFPARYFTEAYGLDYYAAFPGCADDAEPSARTVAFLIDRVREMDVPAVFYVEYSDEKMADVICEDTHCKKLLFHSCHTVSADDLKNGADYLGLMWANAENLKEALG